MQKTNVPEIDLLYENVLSYRTTKRFKELLNFVKRFKYLSPYNAMLVNIQKPGSTYVASPSYWLKKYNRIVKPGARPLLILKPFGPVSFVFDYADTEGEPLPAAAVEPFHCSNSIDESILNTIYESMKFEGIKISFADHGNSAAGFIQKTGESQIEKYESKYLYKIKSNYVIVLNSNFSNSEKFATLIHELAHYFCGHLNNGEESFLPTRYTCADNIKEFEAETVSWIVCSRYNIDTPSVDYLFFNLGVKDEIPNVSVDAILRSAGEIEKMMQAKNTVRKEKLISKVRICDSSGQLSLFD